MTQPPSNQPPGGFGAPQDPAQGPNPADRKSVV